MSQVLSTVPSMDLTNAAVAVFSLVIVSLGLGFVAGWHLARRAAAAAEDRRRDELETTVDLALDAVRHERGEMLHSALETVLAVATSKLGDQLDAGRALLDHERTSVSTQVEGVHSELRRVAGLVAELQKERADQSGRLTSHLERTLEVTNSLDSTTRTLAHALASPKTRGQWGERMAEDVLTAAGFVEGINYVKQRKLASGGIPDYSFDLPRGHVVHMDVKFPLDNYLRWLEAPETEQPKWAKAFQRDVRDRIKELTTRAYTDPETTVDYLLLFVPNESVYGFLHEHDPTVIDNAIASKVVLCSPTTLFAVLAVIRQAVDNFLVERRSDEILAALAGLREQWDRLAEPMDKMGRGLASAQRAFDDLAGPRARQFARQLERLEEVRDARHLTAGPASEGLATAESAMTLAGDDHAVADSEPAVEEVPECEAPEPGGALRLPLRSVI